MRDCDMTLFTPPSMSIHFLLRLEGVLVSVASIVAYGVLGASWWLLVVLFLVPDVSMSGYLAGPQTGAVLYNLAHTYAVPLVIGGIAFGVGSSLGGAVALTWTAHIGLDRALAYGLKRPTGFSDTHLSIK